MFTLKCRTMPYAHRPLPGPGYTRILELYPGQDEDAISCDLQIIRIDEAKDTYTAISYVWGDASKTTEIECCGHKLAITVNAEAALRAFRDSTTPQLFWMDAICINQFDNDEKGHQVARMATIFHDARDVIVWLGHDEDGTAQDCFQLITETNTHLDSQLSKYGNKHDVPALVEPYPICSDRSRWEKVKKLFQLPWFNRLWVINEVSLAKTCTLRRGRHAISIAQIVEFGLWLVSRKDMARLTGDIDVLRLADVFRDIQCTYHNPKTWRTSLPLIKARAERADSMCSLFVDTLLAASTMDATDKRDHVYAFLGSSLAVRPDGTLIVESDYNKETHQVFFDTACALLELPDEARYLLSRASHLTQESLDDPDTPSWVPRWDTPVKFTISRPKFWYQAGGSIQPLLKVLENKALAVDGILFDRVAFTSRIIEDHNVEFAKDGWDEEYRLSQVPFIDALRAECFGAAKSTEEQFEEDFSVTLVRAYPAPISRISDEKHKAEYAAYCEITRAIARSGTNPESREEPIQGDAKFPRHFLHRLTYCENLRVAVLESGRLSLVPRLTKVGDDCCIIPGVPVPFVVRKQGDEQSQQFKLVGESYVHGVMNGEIITRGELASNILHLV